MYRTSITLYYMITAVATTFYFAPAANLFLCMCVCVLEAFLFFCTDWHRMLLCELRSPSSGRSRSASIVSGSCTGSNQLSHLTATSAACSSNAVGGNCYENSARQAFSALLDTVREHYENKLLRIAGCLADKVCFVDSLGLKLGEVKY